MFGLLEQTPESYSGMPRFKYSYISQYQRLASVYPERQQAEVAGPAPCM